MTCKAYFDCACFLNYCGIGYVIRDPNGFNLWKASEYVGRGDALGAEYWALMALLRRLSLLRIQHAVICGDSRTVVCQVRGKVNTRATNRFRKVIFTAREFLLEHPGWALKWIPRAENGLADSLATESLSGIRTKD
jgi:ribonuclease HI